VPTLSKVAESGCQRVTSGARRCLPHGTLPVMTSGPPGKLLDFDCAIARRNGGPMTEDQLVRWLYVLLAAMAGGTAGVLLLWWLG